MSDRECRDLNRGLAKNSPKKNKTYIRPGYIIEHKSVESENRENKSILAQESSHPKTTYQKPFQNKWINERVPVKSQETRESINLSSNKSSLSHLLQSNLTPCALQMQLEKSSLKENENEYQDYSFQNYDNDPTAWKQVKDKEYKYGYDKSKMEIIL